MAKALRRRDTSTVPSSLAPGGLIALPMAAAIMCAHRKYCPASMTDQDGCRQIAENRLRGQATDMDRELASAQKIPPGVAL